MTYAMMTESVCGDSDVLITREGRYMLKIRAKETLTDDQMRDLYWVTLAMMKTGLTLKDIIGKDDTNPCT